jgi:thioester reductase-like protein
MGEAGYILLTGATGFLGRYLLRDLLAAGRRVAVLARDAQSAPARERVAGLLAFWGERLGRPLPAPVVLSGDLAAPGLGLGAADRRWLRVNCRAVVHCAANVSYQPTAAGEPWETNVNGTHRLLRLCERVGVRALHHLSTAFVCGDRRGVAREDELDCGGGTNNAYERSKFAAERLLRQARDVLVTVYRPSVIVGDSRTGYTSTYHHFYRFLELAVRLSRPAGGASRRRLPMRLPLTGEETQDLVPVDWVSQVLVRLMERPRCHGRTFHLTAARPVRLREVKAIVEGLLHLEGVRWAGPGALGSPTSLEEMVLERFRDYWAYLHNSLVFDCRNTREALPGLPPPPFDRDLAARLLAFARADGWGRGRPTPQMVAARVDCARYVEHFFPRRARASALGRVPLDLTVGLEVRGAGGGQWTCRWGGGELLEVRPGLLPGAAVSYRTDVDTFEEIVRGRTAPQEAFFARRVEIEGDPEKALKFAALLGQFVRECPYAPDGEVADADALRA